MPKTTSEMELVPVGKLVPYVNNARIHSPEQILKLRSSLREFGFVNPVIIDRDFNVIAGHGRLLAAKEEGIAEIPCVFAEHLTGARKKAYILADNRMAMDAGFHLAGVCVWVKNSLVLGRSDYQWQREPILYGFLQNGKHPWYSDRKQTTVWNFDKPERNKNHPTSKPLDLLGYPIRNSTQENAIVLDTFGGSGSTLMACEQLNRVCYTMELDEKYASVILRRYVEDSGDADGVSVERNGETIPYSALVKEVDEP